MNAASETIIADVRQFNRFYTRTIGVLGNNLLGGDYSLTELRVLYEIANGDNVMAADLVRTLGMDFGYLSRILAQFEKRGWLKRERSEDDARKSHLLLTAKGRKAFATVNQQSRDEVAKLLEPLPWHQQLQLQAHLRQVQALLSPQPTTPAVRLRTHRAGDMGWIIQRHGALYEKEYAFNSEFEALVAEICAKFLREFDAATERCWIAELGDEPVGTIMLVRGPDGMAKLRLLLVEDSARGHGVGRTARARVRQLCTRGRLQGRDALDAEQSVRGPQALRGSGLQAGQERAAHQLRSILDRRNLDADVRGLRRNFGNVSYALSVAPAVVVLPIGCHFEP